jgi:hypothetical protein
MGEMVSTPPGAVRPRSPWRQLVLVLCVTLSVAAGTFAYVFIIEPALHERAARKGSTPFGGNLSSLSSTPMIWPGVRQPAATPADAAIVAADAEVIGVSVGTNHRAYLVRALNNPSTQVVNDLLGDTPITIAYCDRTRRARAFTGPRNSPPLDMMFGGWVRGKMVVALNQFFYDQDSGRSTNPEMNDSALPLYPCEQTTWEAWRAAHPTTDIYVGDVAEQPLDRANKKDLP